MTTPTPGGPPLDETAGMTSDVPIPTPAAADRVARAIRTPDRSRSPGLTLRQGKIIAAASGVFTVQIGADTTEVTGVRSFSFTSANVNDIVWLLLNGPDVFVLGKLA